MVQSPKAPSAVVNPVYEAEDDSIELVDTKSKGALDAKEKPVSGYNSSNSNNNSIPSSSNGIGKRAADEPEQGNGFVASNNYYDVPQSEKLILADGKWSWCNRKRLLLAAAAVTTLAVVVVVVCVAVSTAGSGDSGGTGDPQGPPRAAEMREGSNAPEVGITSTGTTQPDSYGSSAPVKVRLSDGGRPSRGRLEVLYNGTWGAVCLNEAWSNASALVVCRQLNYTLSQIDSAPANQQSVSATAPIWMANVRCNGTESNLGDCANSGWSVNGCQNRNTVHVRCTETDEAIGAAEPVVVGVQLAGSNANLGRGSVQLVLANGSTASVHNSLAVSTIMSVICRQLNSSTPLPRVVILEQDFSANVSGLWLVGANCLGNETSITQCRNLTWGCRQGVRCERRRDALAIGCSSGQVTTQRPAINTVPAMSSTSSTVRATTSAIGTTPNSSARSTVSVRLSAGSVAWSGRVEVNRNGTWGVVCGQNWNQRTARVVCQQLYRSDGNLTTRQRDADDDPSLPTWSSFVNCSGGERELQECFGNEYWIPSTCSASEHVWIACDGPALRLVGGSSPDRGVLQVFYNGSWGLVCNNGFEVADAIVACRQLGLRSGSIPANVVIRAWHGIFSPPTVEGQPTWMSNLSCVGNESRLSDCPHNGWNISVGCSRYDDVAITCEPAPAPGPTTRTVTHALSTTDLPLRMTSVTASTLASDSASRGVNVRLVGSSYADRGRLEVLYNGVWGLVCRVGFDSNDATVVCRQLGLGSGSLYANAFSRRYYGIETPSVNESQPIWMSNVTCNGGELRLDECPHDGWNNTGRCTRDNDVAIHCEQPDVATSTVLPSATISPTVAVVTATPRTSAATSRTSVISTRVTNAAAVTTVGTTTSTRAMLNTAATSSPLGSTTTSLATTRASTLMSRITTATSRITAATTAPTTSTMRSVNITAAPALRLVGGSDETKGRLEVLYQGQWGFVCSSNFDNNDAIVACRQLGYRSGSVLSSSAVWRYLSGVVLPAANLNTPIWMTDLSCTGSELYLHQCSHSGWNVTRNCSIDDDVAIQCQPMTTVAAVSSSVTTTRPPIQSTGATARAAGAAVAADRWLLRLSQPERKRGNLEIFYNGSWGAVCISGSHDEYDATAKLACQQLNFSAGYAQSDDWQPEDKYVLRDLRCNGSEASVADCNHSSTSLSCDDGEAILVVQCMDRLEERMQGVRLIDGHDNSSGYVQLFVNGSWGFLCGNTRLSFSGWDLTDAKVLCRQLGIIRPQPTLLSTRRRTQLSTPDVNFLADAFDCNGEEPTLWDCPGVQVPAFLLRCGNPAQQAVYAHCESGN